MTHDELLAIGRKEITIEKQLAKALHEIDLLRERVLQLEQDKAELEWRILQHDVQYPCL